VCIIFFGLVAGLSLASIANATVTTYTFATSNEQVAQGSDYCATLVSNPLNCAGKQTVAVYGEQSSDGKTTTAYTTPSSTLSGLFTVTDSPNNFGTGIAPFDPGEGTGSFSGQDGISDNVGGGMSKIDNILLLKLTDVTAGSTLSLLLQAGVSGDQFNVYTSSGAMPTSLSAMTPDGSNPINVDESGSVKLNGSSQPTTAQVTGLTITGMSPTTTGWVAIEADCHYLLLDTLTINSPSGVPEPRFYGILLAAFLGLAGIAYKRRAAQVNA
jgi:hypothetical protein